MSLFAEALFLSRALKKTILLNIVISPCPPHLLHLPFLSPIPLLSGGVQAEENRLHQMGEAGGRGTGVQHQALQSQSVLSSCIYALFLFSFFFSSSPNHPPAGALISPSLPRPPLILSLCVKINMRSRFCLFCTTMRVGSQALLELFISLMVKVGRQAWQHNMTQYFSPHIAITDWINYLCK